jgi:hypothetical protein
MLVINGSLVVPQGDQWWIDVNDGKYNEMGEGKDLRSKCHFCGQGQGLSCRFKRETRRHLAYITGRLKIRGDQGSREN